MKGALQGRVAIVTGGARGIGKAIGDSLAAAGASVVLADIDSKGVEEAARSASREWKAKVVGVALDVTSSESIRKGVRKVMEEFGRVDILVNNAGTITLAPFLELKEKDWDAVMEVNAKGVFLVTQEVAKAMIKGKVKGSIVNISSIAGKVPLDFQAHYCASKAAVISLTRSSALELAPFGIRVNSVCPGAVDTEFYAHAIEYTAGKLKMTPRKLNEQILGGIYIGRLITPKEVGDAVAFLCSDAASTIDGQAINIDGGRPGVN